MVVINLRETYNGWIRDTLHIVHLPYVITATVFYLAGNPNTPIVGNKRWSGISRMHNDTIHGGPGFQITYDQNWPFMISLRKWQAQYIRLLSQD